LTQKNAINNLKYRERWKYQCTRRLTRSAVVRQRLRQSKTSAAKLVLNHSGIPFMGCWCWQSYNDWESSKYQEAPHVSRPSL